MKNKINFSEVMIQINLFKCIHKFKTKINILGSSCIYQNLKQPIKNLTLKRLP